MTRGSAHRARPDGQSPQHAQERPQTAPAAGAPLPLRVGKSGGPPPAPPPLPQPALTMASALTPAAHGPRDVMPPPHGLERSLLPGRRGRRGRGREPAGSTSTQVGSWDSLWGLLPPAQRTKPRDLANPGCRAGSIFVFLKSWAYTAVR